MQLLFSSGEEDGNTKGLNLGFDITPANLISGFITEKGVFKPEDIKKIL